MQFDIHYFAKMSPEERMLALKDNADRVEEMDYMKSFSPDDLVSFKEEFVEGSIELSKLAVKKSEAVKVFADQEKPLKKRTAELNGYLKDKAMPVNEEVYVFLDQDDNMAYHFNSEGKMIMSRQLLPKERQKTFMSQLRAETGTNG